MIDQGVFTLHEKSPNPIALTQSTTLFHMFKAKKELQFTFSFGYTLSKRFDLVRALISEKSIKSYILREAQKQSGIVFNKEEFFGQLCQPIAYYVGCEQYSSDPLIKKRRDIAITLQLSNGSMFQIVIEAKYISMDIIPPDINQQMLAYVNPTLFPCLGTPLATVGIVLTKRKITFLDSQFLSFTYQELIRLMEELVVERPGGGDIDLVAEMISYLPGEKKKRLKLVEGEVVSHPCGETFNLTKQYNVYASPNKRGYQTSEGLYATFRKPRGGGMEMLYQVLDEIILNPHLDLEMQLLGCEHKERVINYVEERKKGYGFNKHSTYKFLILSEPIRLPEEKFLEDSNNPNKSMNIQSRCYLDIKGLLSPGYVKIVSR